MRTALKSVLSMGTLAATRTAMTQPSSEPDDWITASQIASYAYCAESWRLAHGLGLQSRHAVRMEQGIAEHAAWQETAHTASRGSRRGIVLMVIALLGLLLRLWLGG
jgi:hypothetical protein